MTNSSQDSGFALINGANLYYETTGSGDALVFVHAGVAHSGMWDAQVTAFKDAYRIIRFDMRGYGKTESVDGEYANYEDLHALLDHLKVERAHLVGCSKGGGMIADFALAYPERTVSLTMVCSVPHGYEWPGDAEYPPEWDEFMAAFKEGDLEKAARLEAKIWMVGRKRQPEDVDPHLLEWVYEACLIALRNEKKELGKETVLEPKAAARVSEIGVPMLFMIGDMDDPDINVANESLAAELSAPLVMIKGAAHLPSMEKPDDFNRELRAFLDSVTGDKTA